MKLTKYEHACFTIEKDNQILVVDPGAFSSDFIAPERVCAVVITHEHFDHLDLDQVSSIIDKNPEAVIIGHPAVTRKIEVFTTKSVQAGDHITIGPFALVFFGGKHAIIHSDIPPTANLGVIINDLLYYPGDSFVLPERPIDALALPIAAPWMKISEGIDFLNTVHPRLAFPTHDAILSNAGKEVTDRLLSVAASKHGIEYRRLEVPIEI